MQAFFFWLHWVFVAALGLLFTVVCGLLIAVSCLIVDCGVWASHLSVFSYCGAQAVESPGSVVAVYGLCCSAACGIFPDQGSNPCPLHWQADSKPLNLQGSPLLHFTIESSGPSRSW